MLQEFVQEIKETVNEELADIHTALPAEIVSIDINTGLAKVQPAIKKILDNGDTIDYPQISGVPIVFPQGANQMASISLPVKPGDSCLLVIAEQSLENWLYGRETDTSLLFDITNAICIPGLSQRPPDSFKDACEQNSIIIDAGESRVVVSKTGVSVVGNLSVTGNLSVSGTINGE